MDMSKENLEVEPQQQLQPQALYPDKVPYPDSKCRPFLWQKAWGWAPKSTWRKFWSHMSSHGSMTTSQTQQMSSSCKMAPPATPPRSSKRSSPRTSIFGQKDVWPPSSPDLNPLNFSIWAYVQAKSCDQQHPNLDPLKAAVADVWNNLSMKYIRNVCKRFRPRVEAVVAAEGGYIDK